MTKKLDIASDLHPWEDAAQAFLDGKSSICCPLCQKAELETTAACGVDRIGFLLLSCPACGKSTNFSRVKFPLLVKVEGF